MPGEQEKVKIVAFISGHRVEGNVFLYKEGRLSDFLNATTKTFIPLTDVTIYNQPGNAIIARPKFMGLNRNSIIMLYEKKDDAGAA
ncbi:MAG: hypothetical protein COZ37_07500 [bacterium (Candidatus Ratteibacteria) CG_4_10_14_3_um_filter_41_18]|uniref:Uncharacterized protein n=4 Tax=Candidatus Ratteibacteria TaxID=2979319 RepID=A0A2M7YH90_9BACT|nr:MAG: hypothetical protein AUJ76_01955 [Candidatus Omnitrophica bacterium CG1_02_41_171]PIV64653.1 MAG: hypothetical protein COS11_01065 [bacterium (Candidatus Ratteibacteria) CG01_land_8_20_14_3_00_40_19]PIW32420.1 MAG: hypothetical protein COW28_06035 [bacterium (Candidatus Ratteibacteria) CG15_BIG_FIL_POST_REV_8_21_14_020_41_12]PIW74009.1 MAG: hypothetical protein CO004_02965 [bacterium (Candidatus Ratteibacteria) CG_4_8_14_3_um_filter_41_36]PIX76517.1 MAG: hypothetical protein COZ37_07500